MSEEDARKEIVSQSKKIQSVITTELDNIKNSGTLPREVIINLNKIQTGVNELVRAINDKLYHQTTLDDF
jgi:hypothetical protein|tara:strand:+ start:354 stop:563 length:210 start_codon:yes stop_codon:yes gene_type:complete